MGKNQLETYREAEMQSASPVELVIMLYDVLQLREGWQRATSAALSQTEETMVHAGGAANPYASPGEEVRCCGWSA